MLWVWKYDLQYLKHLFPITFVCHVNFWKLWRDFFQLFSNVCICISNVKFKTCPYNLILRVLKILLQFIFVEKISSSYWQLKVLVSLHAWSWIFAISAQYISMPFLRWFFAVSRFWVVCARWVRVRAAAARGRCDTPAPGIATVEKAAPMSRHGTDAAPTARLCLRHDSPITWLSAADIDCSFPLAIPGYVCITSWIAATFDSCFWKKELVTCRSLRDQNLEWEKFVLLSKISQCTV